MKHNLMLIGIVTILMGQLSATPLVGCAECLNCEKPVSWAYENIAHDVKKIDIEQLLASLDIGSSRAERWYASLMLGVLGELCPTNMAPYLSQWTDKVATFNRDNTFFECPAADGSHFIVLAAMGSQASQGYVIQPANRISTACRHIIFTKDDEDRDLGINETWVILAGSGQFALRNKVVDGQAEFGWNVIDLQPGVVVRIPCGISFQFRADEQGFVAHDLTLPPWPADKKAIDDTVEGYWN